MILFSLFNLPAFLLQLLATRENELYLAAKIGRELLVANEVNASPFQAF
jgi:hypothetical protein